MPTITGVDEYGNRSVYNYTITSSGTTPATLWSSNLASIPLGVMPATKNPPFSTLKGSANSIIVAPAPWDGSHALKLTISDADMTAPYVPGRVPASSSSNPGIQLCGPQRQFVEGTEAYQRWQFWIDPTFPALPTTALSFALVAENHGGFMVAGKETWLSYPTPTSGGASPATSLNLLNVSGVECIALQRGAPGYDPIWWSPFKRGQVYQVILHTIFSADPAKGVREVWLDGVKQTFNKNGYKSWKNDPTLHQIPANAGYPAAQVGATEALTSYQMIYMRKNLLVKDPNNPGIVWHGDMKVGPSYASVL